MQKKNVSIKEIAQLSGVSIATVSRVIHNNGRFSTETEQIVKKVIDENGYHINSLAAGLRTGKVKVIGLIVPDITNEYFANMTLVLQQNLFEFGYSTIICNTNEDSEIEKRYLTMLKAQQINGLIYVSGTHIENMPQLNIPTVYIDRKPPFKNNYNDYVFIGSDNEQGGYLATQELIKAGCKKIAIITYKSEASSHINRLLGYKEALKEYKVSLDDSLTAFAKSVTIQQGYEITKDMIAKHEDIDGIFCSADIIAQGAMRALFEIGKRVPEDVKIVGFDNCSLSMSGIIPFSSINQPVEEFGSLSVKLLVDMINGTIPEFKKYIFPVELISRESTRK